MTKIMKKEIEHLFKEKAKIQSERNLIEIDSFVTRCKINNINDKLEKLYEANKCCLYLTKCQSITNRIKIDYLTWLHTANHGILPEGIKTRTGPEYLTKRFKLFEKCSKLKLEKELLKIEEHNLWDKELQIEKQLRNLYSKDFIKGYKQSETDYMQWLYKGKQG